MQSFLGTGKKVAAVGLITGSCSVVLASAPTRTRDHTIVHCMITTITSKEKNRFSEKSSELTIADAGSYQREVTPLCKTEGALSAPCEGWSTSHKNISLAPAWVIGTHILRRNWICMTETVHIV